MSHLRGIQVLIRILPFGSRWSVGLRRHLEHCQKCRQDLAHIEEARTATISREQLEKGRDIWPEFVRRLEREKSPTQARPRLKWRWALGAAALVVAAAATGLFLFRPGGGDDLAAGVKLRINYVTLYEKPARAFIFQTQDANSTFVWVEKQNSGETL